MVQTDHGDDHPPLVVGFLVANMVPSFPTNSVDGATELEKSCGAAKHAPGAGRTRSNGWNWPGVGLIMAYDSVMLKMLKVGFGGS